MNQFTRRPWLFLLATITSLALTGAARAADTNSAPKLLQIVKRISPLRGVKKPADTNLQAYLLVYFKDETHSLYFATSTDGYTFTDVNDAQPVLWGKDVAEQKGIRDPHIMRGPDNAFYLAMTDLHVFGQRAGYRTTQWQRPASEYEWGNNRALVLMKSFDLIHWTCADVRVDKLFPKFGDIGCAWAPETIYDPDKRALMVYFTTRIRTGPNFMVYSYANKAFTTLNTMPQPLFNYPKTNVNTIDGDITKVGDKYEFFYVGHDRPGGIRHAVSDKINQGYDFEPARIDPEKVGTEAPNLWRRNGTDTYVLMYDVFGARPHNMGFSETTDFVHYQDLGLFNAPGGSMKTTNFTGPKHGAVMSITLEECRRLNDYFGGNK